MSKLLITLGLVTVLVTGALAQEGEVATIEKGVKVAANLANITGGDAGSSDILLGFGGGAFITYKLTPQFAVQPEILYMMKGSKEGGIKWKQDYLEIPVLLKVYFPTQSNVKPSLFAGPALSFMMGSKLTNGGSVDIKDVMKSMDYGIVFGGELGLQFESTKLTFDLRYTLGLVKVVDYAEWNKFFALAPGDFGYYPDDPDVKNTNISIMAGLSF